MKFQKGVVMRTNYFAGPGLVGALVKQDTFRFRLIVASLFLFAAALSIQPVAAQPGHPNAERGFAYTADARGNSVSVVDLANGQIKSIPWRISPNNVQISDDGRLLFVVGRLVRAKISHDHSDTGKTGLAEMQRAATMNRRGFRNRYNVKSRRMNNITVDGARFAEPMEESGT